MRAGAEPRLPRAPTPCRPSRTRSLNEGRGGAPATTPGSARCQALVLRSMRAGAEAPGYHRAVLVDDDSPLLRSMRAGAEPRLPPGHAGRVAVVEARSMRAGAEPRLPPRSLSAAPRPRRSLNEGRGGAPGYHPRHSARPKRHRDALNEGRGGAPATTTTAPTASTSPATLNEGRGGAPATTPLGYVWGRCATFGRSGFRSWSLGVFDCQESLGVRRGATLSSR